ncbi:hypothetical protein OIU78_020933 [Salix suchowensis]|nr:hypothetical protein OIU78_020933 [Salix suchowensis]
MSYPGESIRDPTGYSFPVISNTDPRVPLLNLSTVCTRMDSLQQFLSESVNNNTLIRKDQMDMVSSEISSAIHQTIVNAAALLSCSSSSSQPLMPLPPVESTATKKGPSFEGFKRDANLRMHMRAHGNEFKTLEALARPDKGDKTSSASLAGKTNVFLPL